MTSNPKFRDWSDKDLRDGIGFGGEGDTEILSEIQRRNERDEAWEKQKEEDDEQRRENEIWDAQE